jgi:hypothetical protein
MKDRHQYLVYAEPLLAQPCQINLQLPKGSYSATWTDVVTGKILKTENVSVVASSIMLPSPAGVNDKTLVLTKL